MSRPDTLFPALDGSSPGEVDQPEAQPDFRPTINVDEWSLPESRANISSASAPDPSAPEGQLFQEEQPAPTIPVQDAPPPAAPPGRRKRTAEERIGQLTARYRQEQDENTVLRNQVYQLTQMVERVLAPQSRASTPSVPSSGEASPTDILAGSSGGASPTRDANEIEAAIQRALSPIVQRIESQEGANRRNLLHGESFARAAEEFPELAQRGSRARQLFDSLYTSHPLSTLDDGPEQIALMVRGVLESTRNDSAVQSGRKLAAAVQVPSPSPTDATPLAESQANKSTYERGLENLRRGGRLGASLETYKAVRLAGRARSRR